eukprot:CAMPEP_0183710586 /NCGR_PEP_ID=MMETSP0737-20130205/6294_1 /TAXON_ID=385413 /ORGANISM="Thalassiosira miniscula, Strain CCMP1093" /LENGTH=306 /DNA_ID=CAMNT_0025938893 /DNA_START=374 /DNA_END=1291 /DNA_ORIENTATION=-
MNIKTIEATAPLTTLPTSNIHTSEAPSADATMLSSDDESDSLDNSISLRDLQPSFVEGSSSTSNNNNNSHSHSHGHSGRGSKSEKRQRRADARLPDGVDGKLKPSKATGSRGYGDTDTDADAIANLMNNIGTIGSADNENDGDGNGNSTDQFSPLPKPPNHFLCPIQNSLLIDPVIDREGNTYERDAILRWLVLTSQTFGLDPVLEGSTKEGGSSTEDAEGGGNHRKDNHLKGEDLKDSKVMKALLATGNKRTLAADTNILSGGTIPGGWRGTSPITGNPMSVDELVEDLVVKKAIERWRKECWVR